MKKTNYTENFETFWMAFKYNMGANGTMGSKAGAFKKYKALKPTREDLSMLCAAIRSQALERKEKAKRGIWMENFKQPSSWLLNHCWENEINIPTNSVVVKNQKVEDKVKQWNNRDWAEI